MTDRPLIGILAMAVMVVPVTMAAAPSRAMPDSAGFVRVMPSDVAWETVPDSPGVMAAKVLGDPDKPGPYIVRYRFPAHVMDRPHSHSHDRYVTVLQGVWSAGVGPDFDPAKAIPMIPGSVMKHPANGVHWDGSNSDQAVVVQITGEGPVQTRQVDPRAAQWVVVGK